MAMLRELSTGAGADVGPVGAAVAVAPGAAVGVAEAASVNDAACATEPIAPNAAIDNEDEIG
jgi:hypothetical protein